jgi:hypothetical protein
MIVKKGQLNFLLSCKMQAVTRFLSFNYSFEILYMLPKLPARSHSNSSMFSDFFKRKKRWPNRTDTGRMCGMPPYCSPVSTGMKFFVYRAGCYLRCVRHFVCLASE